MKPNYISGEWRESGTVYRNINPSDTGDCIDTYAVASTADVAGAVTAAKESLAEWSASTPQQKFTALDFIGSEILARKEELGRLLAREEGKTLPEAAGEVARAGQIFKFFAGEAVRNPGEHIPSVRPGVEIDTFRQPIGVVGIITPWNFPIAIPAWKAAPALAFGNTVVFKPAELTPGCAWELADIVSRSGVPKGAFNLVMGKGSVVGDALVKHPDVSGVSFTGSIEVGRGIAKTCADPWSFSTTPTWTRP
jgi:acyl-CoA reductase-like NAD-dependent aldehyde dehydrogenase